MKRKGATDWGPIYMLVVIVIGAILVTTLLKPTLKQASGAAEGNLQEAKQIASVQFIAGSLKLATPTENTNSFPLILSKLKKST